LTFDLGLDMAEMNQRAKYPDRRSVSFFFKSLSLHTHTGPIDLPGPLNGRKNHYIAIAADRLLGYLCAC